MEEKISPSDFKLKNQSSTNAMTSYLSVAEQAAREAGQVLREMLGSISVKHKKNLFDLVTEADVAAQKTIERVLSDVFPEHRFLGEEGNLTRSSSEKAGEFCWVVDPLDGTTNYVHGVPLFCTSIALLQGDEPICAVVYNPLTEEFFHAKKGEGAFLNGKPIHCAAWENLNEALVSVSFPTNTTNESADLKVFLKALFECQAIRRTGSTALNLAFVASGRFDASWAFQCHPWDVAAGVLLIREAGGLVSKPDGQPIRIFDDPSPVCAAGNPILYSKVLEMVANTDLQ